MLAYPVLILAGGFGTRLSSVVQDVPKPMAPINGFPFLHYLMSYLKQQKAQRVLMSVGYKSEIIMDYFGSECEGIQIEYVVEKEPLGTGGAIQLAFEKIEKAAFVLNGDTFFDVDLNQLIAIPSDITIALKTMQNIDRYGTVELDENGRISAFKEKQFHQQGMINGGVYFIHKNIFDKINTPKVFSFEKEVLEKHTSSLKIYGVAFENYFIDIGIPEDYYKASTYFINNADE